MDLKQVHDILRFYCNQFQMGDFAPEELDRELDRAQIEHFVQLKPVYGAAQEVHDALLPFKAQQTFLTGSSPGGIVTFNSDYMHLLAAELTVVNNGNTVQAAVDILNEAQISYRRSSQLIPIGALSPCGLLVKDKKLQVYPANPVAGTIYYLRRPAAPVFGYTMSGRAVTYNSGSSTQLEWDEQSTEKIIFKALALLGINLQDEQTLAIGQAKGQ